MRGGQALSSHWPVAAACPAHCHICCLLLVCVTVKGPLNAQIMRNVPCLRINRPRLISNITSLVPRLPNVANVATCFTNAGRCSRCKGRNIVNCCVLRSTHQNNQRSGRMRTFILLKWHFISTQSLSCSPTTQS